MADLVHSVGDVGVDPVVLLPGTTTHKDRDLEVRADLIATIYSHIPRSSLGVMAGAVTVCWGMWGQVAHTPLIGWLGAIASVIVWRMCLFHGFDKTVRDAQHVARAERNWTLSTAIHGSIWGSAALFMYVPGSPEYQALLLVALFAISTAAVPLIGRHLPSLYAFVLPVLTPIILRLAIEGSAIRIMLAVISGLVMYGIFLFGRELNRTITESVQRRYENVELIDELTHQKAQAEAARKDADRANRMKTRFLAAASHDLRQPMHALGLFSDSLQRRLVDPEHQALASRICQSVETLEKTFDALLDISRLDAGIVKANRETFALSDLLDQVCGECAPAAVAKGVRLGIAKTSLAVASDPVLVEQILRNLVSNAIRYTNKGKVLVGCRPRSDRVWIEVWDTGIGISEDKQSRIFDEFYQAADRGQREGLGLGLAIVRRMAELLQVRIELRSVPNKGSVFRVELPRAGPADQKPQSRDIASRMACDSLHGKVMLVIDDDPAVLEAMHEVLTSRGAKTVTAASLKCALARLPECGQYPDVIISDFRLSESENGIDAVERIRHELGVTIPALIITGDTAPKRLQMIEASGFHYLPKPVTAERLIAELTTLLDREIDTARVTRPTAQT
jgi:signal transduction histidine kinase/CheY-like chemotaxis protein